MAGGGGGVGGIADAIGDIFQESIELVPKVLGGFAKSVAGIVSGAMEGDWSKTTRSIVSVVQTVAAVFAIVYGGPLGAVAGTAVLDAQYNNSKLTSTTVKGIGAVETAVVGSKLITEYSAEITAVVTTISSLYVGYVGMSAMMDITGIGGYVDAIPSELKTAYELYFGAQDIYSSYQSIAATREYWEAALSEYYKRVLAQAEAARAQKEQWFSLFSDYDSIGRIMPGGDLYNGGAGSYFFTPTSPHESARYMLSIEYTGDTLMDESVTGRIENRYAGGQSYLNQIEGTIKWR